MPRSRTMCAVLLLATAGLLIVSMIGCGSGRQKTIDPGLADRVIYIEEGYWLPAGAEGIVRMPDRPTRLEAWRRQAVKLNGGYVVPAAAFEWLMKQAAESRRQTAEGK